MPQRVACKALMRGSRCSMRSASERFAEENDAACCCRHATRNQQPDPALEVAKHLEPDKVRRIMMRAIFAVGLVFVLMGCVKETRERCYEPDDLDRPSMPHLVYDEATETCVRVDGVDSGAQDGSMDGAGEATVPECIDSTACTNANKPVCVEGACAPCQAAEMPDLFCAQKDSERPVCDDSSGACVGCLENATCTAATASRCNTASNTCVSCRDNIDKDSNCEHLRATPVCISGRCAECRSGVGDDHCEGKVCNGADGTCSDIDSGKVGLCRSCISSDQCENGQVCATFDGDQQGSAYCLYLPVDDACPIARRPFVEERNAVVVEGGEKSVCGFFFSSVTCEGFLALGTPCDTVTGGEAGVCGRVVDDADIGTGADAYCDGIAETQHRCGIRCTGTGASTECPEGYVCDGRRRTDLDGALSLCVPQ